MSDSTNPKTPEALADEAKRLVSAACGQWRVSRGDDTDDAEEMQRRAFAAIDALAALAKPQAEPVGEDYGHTNHFCFAGVPVSDAGKRLGSMLVLAFGPRHPAIDDLCDVLLSARPVAQTEPAKCENCSGQGYIDSWTADGAYNPTHCEDCDGGRAAPSPPTEPAQPVEDPMLKTEIAPRPLLYPLDDYHRAMSEGPLHYTWQDKPHRLVYDLIAAVRYYASPPAPAQPVAAEAVTRQAKAALAWSTLTEAFIDEYLENYEMRGEDEDGRDGCYTPSETERFVIKDAIMGLLAEARDSSPPAPAQPAGEVVAWVKLQPPYSPSFVLGARRPMKDGDPDMSYRPLYAALPAAPVAALTDEQILAMLQEVDAVAREYDVYEYGLPLGHDNEYQQPQAKMIAAVRAALSASLPVQPTTQPQGGSDADR
jgi:hypothetical protein